MSLPTLSGAGRLTDEAVDLACRVSEFWLQVDRSGGPEGCWPWTGYLEDRYGRFRFEGKMTGSHELAVTFATGERRLPELDTCHSCNNPPCCNPAHLRFDTRLSNVADMVAAGRQHNSQDRLTDEQVRTLRRRRESGAPLDALAEAYRISESYASMLVTGRRRIRAGGPILAPQNERKAA